MRAARAYQGERHMRLEEVPVPDPGPNDVLVRVESAGLTRGLVAMWWFTPMIRLPGTLGHDIAGTVVSVGSDVTAVEPGARVWVSTALQCGTCDACVRGDDNLCRNLAVMGYALYGDGGQRVYERYHDGGFAEYVLAPAVNVNLLPDSIDIAIAGKIGTIAGALRALTLAGSHPGGTLVVTGAGGATGGAVVQLAAVLGYAHVIAVARSDAGLARLGAPDATVVTPVTTESLATDWVEQGGLTDTLRQHARATGDVDALVDLMPMGTDVTLQALRCVRPGGTAVLMGGNVQRLTIDYLQVMRNQWHIVGNRGHRRSDEHAVADLLAGHLFDAERLLTHRFDLDAINEAIDTVMERRASPGMVVVQPAEAV